MNARNGLHLAAVAESESVAVNRFHPPDIRLAVVSKRNIAAVGNEAWHACGPQEFVAEAVVSELVDLAENTQRFPGIRVRRCHKLE